MNGLTVQEHMPKGLAPQCLGGRSRLATLEDYKARAKLS